MFKCTEHVVEPDVPADCVVWILLPAGPRVPQPGLVVEDPHPAQEAAGVEEESPASLAKLGHPGGQVGSPPVPVPSLNLNWRPLLCCHHHHVSSLYILYLYFCEARLFRKGAGLSF